MDTEITGLRVRTSIARNSRFAQEATVSTSGLQIREKCLFQGHGVCSADWQTWQKVHEAELLQGELTETQRRRGAEQTASCAREGRRSSLVHTKKSYDAQQPRQQGCSSWSMSGLAVYTLYLIATILYFYVRVAHTLDLGKYRWYGFIPPASTAWC